MSSDDIYDESCNHDCPPEGIGIEAASRFVLEKERMRGKLLSDEQIDAFWGTSDMPPSMSFEEVVKDCQNRIKQVAQAQLGKDEKRFDEEREEIKQEEREKLFGSLPEPKSLLADASYTGGDVPKKWINDRGHYNNGYNQALLDVKQALKTKPLQEKE